MANWIVKNLVGAVVYVSALVMAVSIFLAVFTHHKQVISVPDFSGMSVAEAYLAAEEAGLLVKVTDSVYVKRMERGAVFSQHPAAGADVKKGRTISLSINAVSPKKVSMPNLVGYSTRQAKAELSSKGLRLGRLVYVNDMATNNVLRQLYRGNAIAAGDPVESGSYIDLVVGLNTVDTRTRVPDVTGFKLQRASDALLDNYLNVRNAVYDRTVRTYADSLAAVVYRQKPEASDIPVQMGSDVTVYLTMDQEKVPVKQDAF